MKTQDILFLFDYNDWANERILGAAARVSPEQFVAPAMVSHGSLRGMLAHALGVEILWRQRCQTGISPSAILKEEEFATFDVLQAAWLRESQAWHAYLATLTDEMLEQRVKYQTMRGADHEDILWQLLAHVVNHGTQCRSEAGLVLTAYGQSPGDLDLLFFFRK